MNKTTPWKVGSRPPSLEKPFMIWRLNEFGSIEEHGSYKTMAAGKRAATIINTTKECLHATMTPSAEQCKNRVKPTEKFCYMHSGPGQKYLAPFAEFDERVGRKIPHEGE